MNDNHFKDSVNSIASVDTKISMLLIMFSCALLMHFGMVWKSPKTTLLLILIVVLQWAINRSFISIIAILISLKTLILAFPRQENHANLETIIAISILVFLIIFKKKYIDILTLAVCFRWAIISIYFWAGFHKLNHGFFNVEGSCSNFIWGKIFSILDIEHLIDNKNLIIFGQVSTIIIEMILPFGLLIPKFRKISIFILFIFHLYLNLNNFSNFSSLAGFLMIGSIIDSEIKLISVAKASRYYTLFTLIAVLISFITIKWKFNFNSDIVFLYKNIFYSIGWIIYFIIIINHIAINNNKYYYNISSLLIVVCISLWALQAYVGLSNTGNLTMFSNLITEKSRNNHFLLDTRKIKIWNFEEDHLTIISVPDQYKNFEGYDLPVSEFKFISSKWVKKNSKIQCILKYQGNIIKISDLKKSEFSKPLFWHKYIYFRKIPLNGRNECLW